MKDIGIGPLRSMERSVARAVLPIRRPLIVLIHASLVACAYILAFLLRFDFAPDHEQLRTLWLTLPVLLVVRLVTFWRFHLFEGLWQYVSTKDLRDIIAAVTLSSAIFAGLALFLYAYGFSSGFPRSVIIVDWIVCTALVAGTRLSLREFKEMRIRKSRKREHRVIIVGAGDAGERLVREIQQNLLRGYAIAGLVDDDPRKRHARLHGRPVIGRTEDLPQLCQRLSVDQILIAVPSAEGKDRRRIVRRCLDARVAVKTVPGLRELDAGIARIGQLRAVQPEDLLGRQAVEVDIDKLLSEISGKRVMVTGAGGSIGSELCRQVASLRPDLVMLYERNESALYFADQELREKYPELRTVPIVGDILDEPKLREVVDSYRPEVVYHAAAYKHVPLMEAQPLEAIQNNVFGTEMVARIAVDAGVRKFVMISTDKAVRPVGVMGMTKKVAEDVCTALNSDETTFVSVRFGNVLGSAGSVLPLFEAQIARGGPVTVTDPEATRYFMIIAEAAQLVLQAGAMGRGGEVFFLDMGEPVRIGDLADNVIRLSGKSPGSEVPVATVGLRPGERLNEQLVRETEELVISEHEKIYLASGSGAVPEGFLEDFERLRHAILERDHSGAVDLLAEMAAR
jgi:FlaA1/EpsC-like NDP-sugar epimerase